MANFTRVGLEDYAKKKKPDPSVMDRTYPDPEAYDPSKDAIEAGIPVAGIDLSAPWEWVSGGAVPAAKAALIAGGKGLLGMAGKAAALPMVVGMANTTTKKTLKEMTEQLASQERAGLSASDSQLMETFGDKFVRQAKAAKKVAKAGDSVEGGKSIVSGNSGKLAPDYFRQLQNSSGEDEVLRQANAGTHLKRQADGGYVGGPRTVTSPQSLGSMRAAFDTQFDNAANAVAASEPSHRVGTWYDRAKQGQAVSNEPHQLPRTLEQHGVYSAGVAPEMELGFALNHANSRALGDPQMAYRSAGMNNLDRAVSENRPAKLAYKIGEYANKNDPRIANKGLFGVNDFRASQAWGYTDPKGMPWKAGASDTMHPFMDAETALAVERANKMGIGGRQDWNGAHLQEMPWILGKAEDLYSRGYKASYSPEKNGTVLDGIKKAVQTANQTTADYFPKHTMSATHEAIPGANIGHVPSILNASPEEKLLYSQTGRWDVPTETLDTASGNVVGAGNRDAIYSALGLRQLPSIESVGAYTNSLGVMEHNPMTIARPLVDMDKGNMSQFVNPRTLKAIDSSENFRALNDAQEAYAANLPVTNPSAGGKSSLLIDTSNRDPFGGVQPTEGQLHRLSEILQGTPFEASATSRGVFLRNSADDPSSAHVRKLIKAKGEAINGVVPGQLTPAAYGPGDNFTGGSGVFGTALVDSNFVPLPQGQGIATSQVLSKFADQPQEIAANLSESEAVRAAIRGKMNRDAGLLGVREDIQNTRDFFSGADWAKAVDLMRKGMAPAAAVAATGYSLNGMAEER